MKRISVNGASWDSIFLSIIRIVTTIGSIVETKILSVGFNLTEYGTYSQIAVVISICNSLIMLGLGDALNYYYNNSSSEFNRDKRLTFVNTIFAVEIIAGVIVAVALFCGKGLISSYYSNPAISSLIIFVAIRPMLTNLLSLYQTLFVSVGRAKVIAVRNLVLSIISIAVISVSVYVFHSIIAMYICTLMIAVFQLLFFALFFSKKEFTIKPYKANLSLVKQILLYAIPMGIFALTNTLVRDVDRLVIGYLSNTETVAIYSNCSKILPYDIIATSFATVLIPYIMKYITGQDNHAVLLFKNYLKIGYYSVVTFGVGTIIVTNQIIPFLYSSEYLAGRSVFVIYIFDSMLKFASMHLVLAASGKTKTIMKYSLISLVANAILNVVLYKLFGMIGPAISTLIVTLGYTIAILNQTRKILNTKWKELFDIKELMLFIIGLVATGIIAHCINYYLGVIHCHEYVNMFITLILFGVANFALCHKRIKRALQAINSLKLVEQQ